MLRACCVLLLGVLAACSKGSGGGEPPPPPIDCGGPVRPACDAGRDLSCLDACRALADVELLASPAFEGRGTGSAGNLAAVELVEDRFAALGLQQVPGLGSWRQTFPLPVWTPGPSATLALGGTPVRFEGMTFTGAGDVSAELVFAGYGITVPPYARDPYPSCPLPAAGYDDYAGIDVTGKIALVVDLLPGGRSAACPPIPGSPGSILGDPRLTSSKVRNASAHGAAGVVVVRPLTLAPEPRTLASAGGSTARPVVPALYAHRSDLEAQLPPLGTWIAAIDGSAAPAGRATGLAARLQVTGTTGVTDIPNVLGVIPGSDPDPAVAGQVVLVGAHLDHLGRTPWSGVLFAGADDNASGTALMLELARLFASGAERPRRTLLFAGWNGEELGLLGSCHYAEVDPRFPLASTVAAFSVDMVGQGSESGLELYGTDADPNPSVGAVMERAAASAGLPYGVRRLGSLPRSDHTCFSYLGVPAALAITPPPHLGYHTPDDLPPRITARNLEVAGKLLHVTIRAYAMNREAALAAEAAFPRAGPFARAPAAVRVPHAEAP